MELEKKPFYKVREVADYLGVNWATVASLIKTGQLKALEINSKDDGDNKRVGTYRIYRESLEKFMQENTSTPVDNGGSVVAI